MTAVVVKNKKDKQSEKTVKKDGKEEEEVGPLSKASDVFSKFGRTKKVKMLRFFGVAFAVISGCIYPVMAYYFARSFEDLGGDLSGSGDYMAKIRELAFIFMILG